MDVIEKQTKEMLKANEEPVANFAPAVDLSWPAPESRRESKCETNIDNLLELREFRRGSSSSTHTRISECWSAPGQIQLGKVRRTVKWNLNDHSFLQNLFDTRGAELLPALVMPLLGSALVHYQMVD